jgi:hypothetical protein
MPYNAYLNVELKCPSCDTALADMLWFQWGFCPGNLPRTEYIYHVGDPIVWKACKDGSIPCWAYFVNKISGLAEDGANGGDPVFRDLIVRDDTQEWLAGTCPSCHQAMGGGALEIHDGIIVRGWICRPSELGGESNIYLIGADNKLRPMIEWNNHALSSIHNCE